MQKKLLSLLVLCMMSITVAFAKGEKQVVVFDVDLHCQGCITKIEKNIAFEKGVKDLQCDLKAHTVTVVFMSDKTDIPTLQKAFAKLGKTATVNKSLTSKASQSQPKKK